MDVEEKEDVEEKIGALWNMSQDAATDTIGKED